MRALRIFIIILIIIIIVITMMTIITLIIISLQKARGSRCSIRVLSQQLPPFDQSSDGQKYTLKLSPSRLAHLIA